MNGPGLPPETLVAPDERLAFEQMRVELLAGYANIEPEGAADAWEI